MTFLRIIGLAIATLAATSARPVSTFTVKCAPGALQCGFDGSRSTDAISYAWNWGDGRTETHTQPGASNTWPAGTYCVTLVVKNAAGDSSYATKLITVPTSTSTFKACPRTVTPPPPVIPPPAPVPAGETRAELPRVYLDTRMPATTGAMIAVPAGGDLQAALNKAQPGDVIALANGATYAGNFTLPNKTGASWITIRPASMVGVPPEGTRMTPAAATAAQLPRIVSTTNQGAFNTDFGAHHYRLIALEVTVPSTTANTGLIRLGTSYETTLAQMPHDIVLDRMYVHGTTTGVVRRAIVLNGASEAVVDSYVSEVHDNQDSQAIAGWNGPGPFKIVNNYLEAASENASFGGADPTIQGLIPSDIEIRGNHMTKPIAWQGRGYNVKNLFEIKNAQRVLVEGNVFENNWADGQGGSAINLKSVNQSGGCRWCAAKDITFRLNVIRNTGSGFALSGYDPQPLGLPVPMTRVTIVDNIVTVIDATPFTGDGRGILINGEPIDLVIAHNTILDATNSALTFGGPDTLPPKRLTLRDNIIDGGQYGVKGPGLGTAAALATFAPAGFRGNLIITTDPTGLPAGSAVPNRATVGFTSATDLLLAATSRYRGTATTGGDPGANVRAVYAATAGAVQP